MTTFDEATLHEDANRAKTSSVWNETDSRWEQYVILADDVSNGGGIGAIDDGAVTNPANDATVISALKGLLTRLSDATTGIFKAEDTVAADAALGIPPLAVRRDTAASSADAAGDWATFNVDANGRLYVLARRDTDVGVNHTTMSALASSLQVKASAGVLHGIIGYVDSGEDGFIMVFDATADPGDGAAPDLRFPVNAASAAQGVQIPLPGHACSTGILVMWSTTGDTLTEGAAKLMITGHYE